MVRTDLVGVTLRPGLELIEVIARGSFGTVYRARQTVAARDVAVKVLHEAFDPDDMAGQLFVAEVHAIGKIDHRNVVRLYDAERTADGRLYFVMELLAGRMLQQIADAGAVPASQAIAWIAQLLDGLAAVHAAGHIHADVKPSNAILVGAGMDERVVLVDFGLSRLRPPDRPAEAVGGTRAYMAPEQLSTWAIDARSDVFAAALVLVRLLTGWQREHAEDLVPPLEGIDDAALRLALDRALSIDISRRPTARDFAHALRGGLPDEPVAARPPPPFRHLVPLTERDRGRLHGREADVLRLARDLSPSRPIILAAPSGTGKTSLLRAGLMPYLHADGIACVCFDCRTGGLPELVRSIEATASRLDAAMTAWGERCVRRALILDQIEAWLGRGDPVLAELLALSEGSGGSESGAPEASGVAIVLGVREDFVARLLASNPLLARGVPQHRLLPLDRTGACAALVGPLAEHGVAAADELLQVLLDDLVRVGDEMGAALGWDTGGSVYPPHLQLMGEALWSERGPRETKLTGEHYRRLGGLDAVIAEHLERKLATRSTEERTIVRAVFLELVASSHTRAVRAEPELLEVVGGRYGDDPVREVLARLEHDRLIARRVATDGNATWEVIHDSLVPRIEAWISIHDLDRRRAAEILRFHLRQSTEVSPSLLGARALRRIDGFSGIVDELETEWLRRPTTTWTPRRLVARSRQVVRYRRTVIAAAVAAVAAITTLLMVRWLDERARRNREAVQRDRDLGSVTVVLAPFDWVVAPDTGTPVARPVDASAFPQLDWTLHDPAIDDPQGPGERVAGGRIRRGRTELAGGTRIETGVEVRGGDAFFIVAGRNRVGEAPCPPSVIPVRRLPGYAHRGSPRELRLAIPSCLATFTGTIDIPEGPFIYGGRGEPPPSFDASDLPPEEPARHEDRFAIDRTEVTNAAFAQFTAMAAIHGIWIPDLTDVLKKTAGPTYPRGNIDWFEARAYCRFLGKELPTLRQWRKAFRGGLRLPDGTTNPMPRRNLPWGALQGGPDAALAAPDACLDLCLSTAGARERRAPSPVGRHPGDVSPYGVLDLAGNVQEWSADIAPGAAEGPMIRRSRAAPGGNWHDTNANNLIDYLAIANDRSPIYRSYSLGVRCVLNE